VSSSATVLSVFEKKCTVLCVLYKPSGKQREKFEWDFFDKTPLQIVLASLYKIGLSNRGRPQEIVKGTVSQDEKAGIKVVSIESSLRTQEPLRQK